MRRGQCSHQLLELLQLSLLLKPEVKIPFLETLLA